MLLPIIRIENMNLNTSPFWKQHGPMIKTFFFIIYFLVNSFVELSKELLPENEGKRYLLSERFSQDPLEEYFSLQRKKGGSYENPSSDGAGRQFVAISTMKI